MLLRGRWLAGHVVALAVVVAFVALGFWQLGRNQEKQNEERDAEAALAAPAPALDTDGAEPGTRVEVTGVYDPAHEALWRNRVRGGEGGYDVLTPFTLEDGSVVIVDRGWVSRDDVRRGLEGVDPAAGTVTVRGVAREPSPLEADDTVDEIAGRAALPRVDVEAIASDTGDVPRDLWIEAQWQDPAPANGTPALPEATIADRVNHLSYAFQWFAFAAIVAIGWPVVLARRARRRAPSTGVADTRQTRVSDAS